MRKLFRAGILAVLPFLILALTGCTDMVRDELDETHSKLAALQELVASVNNQLTALDVIVGKLDNSHSIIPASFTETEEGFDVSFRDGTTVHIHFGKDGKQLVPVGVRSDADSLFYWTIDGEWMLDAEGNKILAGATEGVDGIAPQFLIEDGLWKISVDGGETYEVLGTCEEINGIGVFSGIDLTDPAKAVLILWDGTVIELPRQIPFRMAFSGPVMDTVAISAGEALAIPYELLMEGDADDAPVVTSGTDGTYFSQVVAGDEPGTGIVRVQAPEAFSEGYILLTAVCNGYSAIKMISFRERQFPTGTQTVRFGRRGSERSILYEANFDVSATVSDRWIDARYDAETSSLIIAVDSNSFMGIREGTVIVHPADNPDLVCTTFRVVQAGNSNFEVHEMEAGPEFSYVAADYLVNAPAAGGDATVWISSIRNLSSLGITGVSSWIHAEITQEDGFYKLQIQLDPNETTRERNGGITIRAGVIPVGVIKIVQAGAAAGE